MLYQVYKITDLTFEIIILTYFMILAVFSKITFFFLMKEIIHPSIHFLPVYLIMGCRSLSRGQC